MWLDIEYEFLGKYEMDLSTRNIFSMYFRNGNNNEK